jgi:hypothetical protein
MLSIALIAAVLVAWFLLQLRRETEQRAVSDLGVLTTVSYGGERHVTSTSNAPGTVVALVLRVQNADCACENARKYADKTFLVGDAPKLPFKDCTRADCTCRYERIAERRNRGERRVKANRREEIRFEMKDDRRTGKDRRRNNNVWKQPV